MNLFIDDGTGFVGPLDAYTAGIFSAGGVTLLLGAWTGALYDAKDTTTSTVYTISPLSNGTADTAAMMTAVGSHTVVITKFYDQTGNGNYFAPSASGREPVIVSGSTLKDGCVFDGTDDDLQCINNGAANSAKTLAWNRTINTSPGPFCTTFEYGNASDIGITGDVLQEIITPAANLEDYISDISGYSKKTYSDIGQGYTTTVLAKGGSPGYAGLRRYNATTELGGSGTETSGGGSAGSFGALKWRFGRRNDGYPANINLRRYAIWDADKSADAVAIAGAMA